MKPRLSVGRCCCEVVDCILCQDDFDRANSTDIDSGSTCGWTEEAGDASIESNTLRLDTNEIVLCNTSQAGADPDYIVTVKVQTGTDARTARVLFNYVDSSTYDYVELVFHASAGIFRLVDGVSTVSEETGLAVPVSTWHTIEVCYTNGRLTATYTNGSTSAKTTLSGNVTGVNGKISLASLSNAVYFDDFDFQKHANLQSGCPQCTQETGTCSCCDTPDPFKYYVVDLGAGGWTSEDCDDCESIAGEYVVEEVASCLWTYAEPNFCPAPDECYVTPTGCPASPPANVTLSVKLQLVTGGANCFWRVTVTFTWTVVDPCNAVCTDEIGIATWESANIADTDCQTLPVTLTKQTDSPGSSCDGAMPTTITLESAG